MYSPALGGSFPSLIYIFRYPIALSTTGKVGNALAKRAVIQDKQNN